MLGEKYDLLVLLPTDAFANHRTPMSALDSALKAGVGAVFNSIGAAAASEVERETIKTMVITPGRMKFGFDRGGLHLGNPKMGHQLAPSAAANGSSVQRIEQARADINRAQRQQLGDSSLKASLPKRSEPRPQSRQRIMLFGLCSVMPNSTVTLWAQIALSAKFLLHKASSS